MANKSLFSSIKSLAAAGYGYERGRRRCLPARAEACAGAACGHGLLQRHVLRERPRTSWTSCKTLIDQVDDNVFLAKLAVYSRERAYMKDMPAALLVVLSKRDRRCSTASSTASSTTAACCARCSRWSARASSAARACRRRCSGRSSAG